MSKHFTIDDYSHYVFTPRDLTSWVLGLLRYPLSSQEGERHLSVEGLLEMWAYEACRLFRDRLVGQKAQEKFDSLLDSVVRSDWSVDLSSRGGGAMYVTWGAVSKQAAGLGAKFGHPLGRLSTEDMHSMVGKTMTAYGK